MAVTGAVDGREGAREGFFPAVFINTAALLVLFLPEVIKTKFIVRSRPARRRRRRRRAPTPRRPDPSHALSVGARLTRLPRPLLRHRLHPHDRHALRPARYVRRHLRRPLQVILRHPVHPLDLLSSRRPGAPVAHKAPRRTTADATRMRVAGGRWARFLRAVLVGRVRKVSTTGAAGRRVTTH